MKPSLRSVIPSFILFSYIFLSSLARISIAEPNCTITINSSTSIINGRSYPYNSLKGGDTICISAGTRGNLAFENISGSAGNPIKIINSGGKVVINDSGGWYGLYFANSKYFRLTGTGSNDQYGIQVLKSNTFGVFMTNKTDYAEVDHLEFREINSDGIAIHVITNASCPNTNGNNDDDWDYNGDGKIDSSDVVNRSNYTQTGLSFHDNYFNGFIKSDGQASMTMAYYIGNSNYSYNPYTRTCIGSGGANNTVAVQNPVLDGVSVYNNIISHTSDKSLQIGSAKKNCSVYNNKIDSTGLNISDDVQAININPGSSCNVYGNLITNVNGNGITYGGEGGKIYNNVIVNNIAKSYWKHGIYIYIRPSSYHHGQNTHIFNNTIINPPGNGIAFAMTEGSANRVQNNLIINPGAGALYGTSGSNFIVDHNLNISSINDVKFTNYSVNDYSLQSGSPAINSAADLSSLGVTTDFRGAVRPQGNAWDIGAYESGSAVVPTYEPVKIKGDANGDNHVDGLDYIIWLKYYGRSGLSGASYGDFNSDTEVNGLDYIIWLNNYDNGR